MIVVENEETNNKKSNFDYNKLTKARVFIRCMLSYPFDFYGDDFHNCYIGKTDPVMYLVFKKPIKDFYNFNKINDTLNTDEYYCGTKSTNNWHIIKMNIPQQYVNDYYKFIDGKYSKMSEDYKENLLNTLLKYDVTKIVYKKIKECLYPTKEARKKLEDELNVTLSTDAEVMSIPNLDIEIYKDEHFKD
jgi:hypothetical protein